MRDRRLIFLGIPALRAILPAHFLSLAPLLLPDKVVLRLWKRNDTPDSFFIREVAMKI